MINGSMFNSSVVYSTGPHKLSSALEFTRELRGETVFGDAMSFCGAITSAR